MRKSELEKHIPKIFRKDPVSELFKAGSENVYMLAGIEKFGPYGVGISDHTRKIAHFTWGKDYITAEIRPEGIIWHHTLAQTCGMNFRTKEKDSALAEFMRREKSSEWGICSFEDRINAKKRANREDRKQKRIDDFMATNVPPLPNGFTQRIRKMGKDLKTGGSMNVKMFQKIRDGAVIERMFQIYKEDQRIRITEFCRAFTATYGEVWSDWYYGEYYGWIGEKQKFWPKKQGPASLPKRYFVYDNFATEDMTRQQESCLKIMSGKADPSCVLMLLYEFPKLEQVIKSGWTRIAADLCQGKHEDRRVDIMRQLAHMPKPTRDRLCRSNAGWWAWKVLEENPKLSDHWLNEISRWKLPDKINTARRIGQMVNLNHALTLIAGTGLTKNRMDKYLDYLRMAQDSGRDIHDELIYRDKRWEERHDAYLEEINARKDKEWEQEREKKFGAITKDYERNKRIFEWQQDGTCMVIPKSFRDIVKEGRLQHHCVGASDRYMGSMARRETWIIFLRHADDPETPWYTIETDGKKILQFYAAYDRQPEKEKVQKILQEWMKSVRRNMEREIKAEAGKSGEEENLQAAG